MRRSLLLFLSPLLLAAGCGRSEIVDPLPHALLETYLPSEVVLRIDLSGGIEAFEYLATRLPMISVYGDGRVITEGPVIDIYPAPALPNVVVRTISIPSVRSLAAAALRAGVGQAADLGNPAVMDGNSTVFTVLTADGVVMTKVPALGISDGLSREQIVRREALIRLRDALLDLPRTLGAEAAGEEKPYDIPGLAAVPVPWFDPALPGVANPPELAWPGPALPEQRTVGGRVTLDLPPPNRGRMTVDLPPDLGCVTVDGADLDPVLALAATANRITPWTSEGRRSFIWFRPLLPDEASCDDI